MQDQIWYTNLIFVKQGNKKVNIFLFENQYQSMNYNFICVSFMDKFVQLVGHIKNTIF